MDSTAQLALPLVQPGQAQKHVTVNEALMRLDAIAALVLASRSLASPPPEAVEGSAWALPAQPAGDWAGQGGRIAVRANGGWVFLSPRRGWRAWIADEHQSALHDGTAWRGGAVALSPSGAGSFLQIREFDHGVGAGDSSVTEGVIPANALVFAVTARVIAAITGTLGSWQLGNAGAPDRFGAGMGLQVGAFARGLLAAPMAYYQPTPLVLTATGGSFSGGAVRFAVHYFEPSLPGE